MKIFEYWKKGWKFIGMVICFNVVMGGALLPFYFLFYFVGMEKSIIRIFHIVILVLFSPLVGYWVLHAFHFNKYEKIKTIQ